jgi:hypothetical protein
MDGAVSVEVLRLLRLSLSFRECRFRGTTIFRAILELSTSDAGLLSREVKTFVCWLIIRSRREFPVCPVEKGLISEDLGHCQTDAEEQ